MGCTACAKRRAKLKALKEQKKLNRQGLQAAAIGAVLVASETVGKVLGIGEDTEDGITNVHHESSGGDGEPRQEP